jgi:predicted DNA binding protein
VLVVEYESDNPVLRASSLALPEAELTTEEQQATQDGRVRLLVWAAGVSDAEFKAAIEADPTATDPELLVDHGDRRLYRILLTDEGMEWTTHHRWVQLDGSFIEGRLEDGTWTTRMRLPDRAAVEEHTSWYTEQGMDFRLRSVWTKEPRLDGPDIPQLTERQVETFARALEAGYYDIPRETSTAELAEEFGISEQAVIERLRRATKTLGEHVLVADDISPG